MEIALKGLRDKYLISDEHVVLCLGPDVRTCSPPPGCYSMYEEHLNSGITFPPHLLVVEVLKF